MEALLLDFKKKQNDFSNDFIGVFNRQWPIEDQCRLFESICKDKSQYNQNVCQIIEMLSKKKPELTFLFLNQIDFDLSKSIKGYEE